MDRQIIYPGQIAVETDLLNTNRNTMISIGKLAGALLGTAGSVNGLAVSPGAALTVSVGPGEIYQLGNVDNTAYSSLPADTANAIVKQGIMMQAQVLACAAPATVGYSINYLIQATYQDMDTGAVALPYFNASNPTQAYSGPNNNGASQATKRIGSVVLNAKAGAAATTGSQATPGVDTGYIALAIVTVANGQATIVAANIATVAAAKPGQTLTPYNFGGKADGVTDDSAAVQALINYVKASYMLAVEGNNAHVDLGGKTWLCATSINATNIRPNPGSGTRSSQSFVIKNGHLHGTCTGKTVLDCASTSYLKLIDVEVTGDEVNQPQCGIYYGLGVTPVTGRISGSSGDLQGVRVSGFFSKAGLLAFAAEVDNHADVHITNQSRSLTAVAMASVSCMDTINTYLGGITSDYIALPPAGVAHSNILHNWNQPRFLRSSDIQQTIQTISKSNPAVVTMLVADLANAALSNGDKVYFGDVGGMTQLQDTIATVQNINAAAGTFELAGIDSTTYGTWTSGGLANATGPALLLNGNGMVYGRAGYMLSYGAPSVVIDMTAGDSMTHLDLEFQQEPHTTNPVRVDLPATGNIYVNDFRIVLLGKNQRCADTYLNINSAGGFLTVHNFEFSVVNMPIIPANKMVKNANLLVVVNAVIRTPVYTAFSDTLPWGVFNGVVYATDRAPYTFYFGSKSFERLEFSGYTVAALPTAAAAGSTTYATNGRKNGEVAGAGTGVLVFRDATAWRAVDTGATVAA